MKNRSLLILSVLVVAFGLFITLWERHQPTTGEARKEALKLFPGLEEKDVNTLELSGSQGDISFEKLGERWRIRKPIDADAEQYSVSSLIRSLLTCRVERKLEDVSLGDYGLENPEYSVIFSVGDEKNHKVNIGSEMPMGSTRALQIDGGAVLLARVGFMSELSREVDGWRSHEVLKVNLGDLAAVEIQEPDARIEALHLQDSWRLKSPVEDLADEEQLRNVVSGLNSIRITEFVDDSPDLEEMGLRNPRYRIRMTLADGSPDIRLEFGAVVEDESGRGARVACRRGDDEFFWVNDGAETPLGKAPVLWRESRLYPFESWDVQSLKISTGSRTAEFSRIQGVWKLSSGEDARAEGIEKRLVDLAGFRAENFDLIKTGRPEMGRVELLIQGPGEENSRKLLYTFFEPMGKGGNILVEVNERPGLMGIDSEKGSEIFEHLDELLKPEPAHDDQGDSENSTKTS